MSNILSSKYESDSVAELRNFFGDDDKMHQSLRDIEQFGEKFLPIDTFINLSSNVSGIKSIYKMMESMEPEIRTGTSATESLNERDLHNMMKDPKYWREHDSEYIRKIENGFKKLYQ